MLKRCFDIVFSFVGIIIVLPVFVIISLFIIIDSRGGVFYRQLRVGKGGKEFGLLKFRTMHTGADKQGLLTVGGKDSRITRVGLFLRKYKIDELPQLFNVIAGSMSLVGPRPEVKKYVDLYTAEQLKVLTVKPGITDYASIEYSNESELLGKSSNPDKTYVEQIMPTKINLALKYINEMNILTDVKIIFKTIAKILR